MLASEIIYAILVDMNSNAIQGTNFLDPTSNHNCLCEFLFCTARKYNESRQCYRRGKTKLNAPKTFIAATAVDTETSINTSLFFNAILYWVFAQTNLQAKMFDKAGRPYPSNAINALYSASWDTAITPERAKDFKGIFTEMERLLDREDDKFYYYVDQTIIPFYLGDCLKYEMPSYEIQGEAKIYKQIVRNKIITHASKYLRALLQPNQSGTPAHEMYRGLTNFVVEMRKAAGAAEPAIDPEAARCAIHVEPVEEITGPIEMPEFDVESAKKHLQPLQQAAVAPAAEPAAPEAQVPAKQVEIGLLSALLEVETLEPAHVDLLVDILISHKERCLLLDKAISDLTLKRDILESEYKILSCILERHKKDNLPEQSGATTI